MKIMGPGVGFFFCVGIGLGLGLFASPGWGWLTLAGAIMVAVAGVLLKSEHYRDYIEICEDKGTKPNVPIYIALAFLQNSVIIFVVALIVFFVKGFLFR